MKRLLILGGALIVALLAWTLGPRLAFAGHSADHAQPAKNDRSLHGDALVLKGLVGAAAKTTAQGPQAIRDQLAAGQSIAGIAQEGGFSTERVLEAFDQAIDAKLGRAVERGRLPESIATARAAWYKQSARLQIDQPGLTPSFPGLHEMHGLTIGAASRASGIRRSELRDRLKTCATLKDIVAAGGTTSDAIIAEGMHAVDGWLDAFVTAGQITTNHRDTWRPVLEKTITAMVSTPGLHVAGKECAS